MKLIASRNLLHGRQRIAKGKPFEADDDHAERLVKNGLATKPGGKAKEQEGPKKEKEPGGDKSPKGTDPATPPEGEPTGN